MVLSLKNLTHVHIYVHINYMHVNLFVLLHTLHYNSQLLFHTAKVFPTNLANPETPEGWFYK